MCAREWLRDLERNVVMTKPQAMVLAMKQRGILKWCRKRSSRRKCMLRCTRLNLWKRMKRKMSVAIGYWAIPREFVLVV